MAYDFLGLTNDICRRLNETELTAAQFPTAVGVYSQLKRFCKRRCTGHQSVTLSMAFQS